MSVVTNGLPVPVARITTRPCSRCDKRAAADERLGNFLHADRGQEPGRASFVLERVLQCQTVDHGRRHPHVVGGRFLDHVRAARELRPAEDVAAAHDDRKLDAAARPRGRPAARSG